MPLFEEKRMGNKEVYVFLVSAKQTNKTRNNKPEMRLVIFRRWMSRRWKNMDGMTFLYSFDFGVTLMFYILNLHTDSKINESWLERPKF